MLFVHDGQWVVQDVAGATSLNDAALSGAAALHVGDVITIGTGNSPATIEIDPAGVDAGRIGAAAVEMVATPLPVAAPVAAAAGSSRMPQAVGISAYGQSPRPMGRMMPPAPPPPPPGAQTAVAEDEDAVDWGLPADTSRQPFYVPRQKQNAGPMIAFGVIAAVAIIGGMIGVISYLKPPPAPAPVACAENRRGGAETPQEYLYDAGQTARRAAPAATCYAAGQQRRQFRNLFVFFAAGYECGAGVNAAPPAPAASAPDSADDSDAGDPDLEEVEGAVIAGDPATAILKLDDYAQKHPGKNQAKLKKFENDCLDRLWWQRVTQLCNKRAHLYKDIALKAKDLREATTASFKAETTKEEQALEVERQRSDDVLRKEMGYSDDAAPDISDRAEMNKLRAAHAQICSPRGRKRPPSISARTTGQRHGAGMSDLRSASDFHSSVTRIKPTAKARRQTRRNARLHPIAIRFFRCLGSL